MIQLETTTKLNMVSSQSSSEVPSDIEQFLRSSFNKEEVNVDGLLTLSSQTGVSYKKDWMGRYTGDVHIRCLINPYTYFGFRIPFDDSGRVHGDVEFLVEEHIMDITKVLPLFLTHTPHCQPLVGCHECRVTGTSNNVTVSDTLCVTEIILRYKTTR